VNRKRSFAVMPVSGGSGVSGSSNRGGQPDSSNAARILSWFFRRLPELLDEVLAERNRARFRVPARKLAVVVAERAFVALGPIFLVSEAPVARAVAGPPPAFDW